ncbi:hypothetical protein F4561_004010 [Lipingzhangella halophila]|uniref:Uncharacterized protein n=1 Tax=Lipingzhangella halophila TaxID=1783352 RepID=A0A7W7RJM5_9ACTN|nr:hypothetical protein [Lipingzhangella halophila]MBB4933190.1 hypothetical protein [Lipingzhangella halophila]
MPETIELRATLVQVVKGGEPDECGFSLSDVRSPHALSYFGPGCACGRTVLLFELWERLEHLDLFSRGTDLWLRTVPPDWPDPLPDGATLLEEHTVMVGIG